MFIYYKLSAFIMVVKRRNRTQKISKNINKMKNRTTQKKNKRHASKRTRKLVGGRMPRIMPRIGKNFLTFHQRGVSNRRQAKAARIKTRRYRKTKERKLQIASDRLGYHTKKIKSRKVKLDDLIRRKAALDGLLLNPNLQNKTAVKEQLNKVNEKIDKTKKKYNKSIKNSDKDMKAVAKATEKMAKSSLKKQENLLKHGVTKSSMLRYRNSQISNSKMFKTKAGIELIGKKADITAKINKIKKDLENKDLSPKERMDLVTKLGEETSNMTNVINNMKAERNRYLGDKKKKFYNKRNIRKNQAKLENMTKKIDKLTNRDTQISAAKSIVDKRQAIKVDSAKGIILKETATKTAAEAKRADAAEKAAADAAAVAKTAAKTASDTAATAATKTAAALENVELPNEQKLKLANELVEATKAAAEAKKVAEAAAKKAEVAAAAKTAATKAKTKAEKESKEAATAEANKRVQQALAALKAANIQTTTTTKLI